MAKIVAYASSTRPNQLWSAAQFNSALEKNRTECDIPLVSKADYDELMEVMKGIEHFSDALDFREDTLSKALCQWINAGRAIIAKEDTTHA